MNNPNQMALYIAYKFPLFLGIVGWLAVITSAKIQRTFSVILVAIYSQLDTKFVAFNQGYGFLYS